MDNYTIKQISEITGLTGDTLRYYEKAGVLTNIKRASNGHRVYTNGDLEWLKFVNCLKNTGMTLNNIKEYKALMNQGDKTAKNRKDLLLNQRKKILSDMDFLNEALNTIDYKIKYYQSIEEGF